MSMPDHDALFSNRLRPMRIVILALVVGVMAFLAVAVVIRNQGAPLAPPMPFITYLALAVGAINVALSLFLPGSVMTQRRRQLARCQKPATGPGVAELDDLGQLCALFQTKLILGATLLEGAAFFLVIAYLQEGELIALVALVVLLALLLVRFPTRPALESWLAEQQELLSQERLTS